MKKSNSSWLALGLMVGLIGCESQASKDAAQAARIAAEQAQKAQAEAEKVKAQLEAMKPAASAAAVAATAAAPASAAASAAPVASEAPAAVTPGSYPLDAIKVIPESCVKSSVMLSAVPTAMAEKPDFLWAFAVQAFYANPQLKLTTRAQLTSAGQVALEQIKVNANAVGLFAFTKDGATANRAAAMFKGAIPTAKPELYCGKAWDSGKVPKGLGNPTALADAAKEALKRDASSMCARIGACTKYYEPSSTEDVGVACQREPSKYKYQCAKKATCQAVVACTKS